MTAYTTQGTTIARGDAASPETFATIPQVTNIGSVGQSRALTDTTNLSSTSREYLKQIPDGQEIELTIQYDPDDATLALLRGDVAAETTVNFKVTLTDSPAQTIDFAAQVTNFSLGDIGLDEVQLLTVTMKPSGDLTWS